jgi:CHASE2 domain-containing sensor protein
MPGIFLHANYIEALDGERGTFAPLPDWIATVIEFGLAIALTLIGDKEIHALWKGLAVCGGVLVSFFLTYVLLGNIGIFMDFLVPLCILMLHTPLEKIIAWRLELHDIRHGKGATHGTSED